MQGKVLERERSDRKPAAASAETQQQDQGVERERLEKPTLPQRFKPPIYYALPVDFCLDPPLTPRRVTDPKLLNPFEMAVLAGILYAAGMTLGQGRKAAAFSGGKTAIVEERGTAKRCLAWLRKRERPPGQGKPKQGKRKSRSTRETAIRQAGADGYRSALAKLRKDAAPDAIFVTVSAHHLLQLAGLDVHGRNPQRLAAALGRLQQPVGRFPALLNGCERHGSRLSLTVDGIWLDQPFRKIPAPLPLTTSAALALWLFGFVVAAAVGDEEAGSVDAAGLRRKLCIAGNGRHATASLDNALAAVNERLDRLDWPVLKKQKIFKPRLAAALGKSPFLHPRFSIVSLPRPFGEVRYRIALSNDEESEEMSAPKSKPEEMSDPKLPEDVSAPDNNPYYTPPPPPKRFDWWNDDAYLAAIDAAKAQSGADKGDKEAVRLYRLWKTAFDARCESGKPMQSFDDWKKDYEPKCRRSEELGIFLNPDVPLTDQLRHSLEEALRTRTFSDLLRSSLEERLRSSTPLPEGCDPTEEAPDICPATKTPL